MDDSAAAIDHNTRAKSRRVGSQLVTNPATENPASPSFAKFSFLPTEIRHSIWKAAMCGGRAVVLYSSQKACELECSWDHEGEPVRLGPHVLRSVNHESRFCATESVIFRLIRHCDMNIALPNPAPTWMDPVREWLCIDPNNIMLTVPGLADIHTTAPTHFIDPLTVAVQNIAIIDRDRSLDVNQWLTKKIFNKHWFPGAKTIAIVRNIITVHAPAKQAWAAGLLHYGDTVVLVNINDSLRLRQFYEFYLRASKPKFPKTLSLLQFLMQPKDRFRY
ncbi:hypothetical protein F4825DRAFT_406758 [Nemania diffusa]|nr:hypothetical protein F4825DRAFT_406758 [Nemania diffusa]